jgi:hypothetical protein
MPYVAQEKRQQQLDQAVQRLDGPAQTTRPISGEGYEAQAAALAPAAQPGMAPLGVVQAKPADTATVESEKTEGLVPTRGSLLGWPMWVVPDGYEGPMPTGNWISGSSKAKTEELFSMIKGGGTSIQIFDDPGTAHHSGDPLPYPGFTTKVLKMLKRLLTTPTGRDIVRAASAGPTIEIRPSYLHYAKLFSDEESSFDPTGRGSSSVMYLQPYFSDQTLLVEDKDGNEIAMPVFLVLGHELIHAVHAQDGEMTPDVAGGSGNLPEEYATMHARTGRTENALRREHGLGERYGHSGRYTNARTTTVEGGGAGG